jgi:hypothetical protein
MARAKKLRWRYSKSIKCRQRSEGPRTARGRTHFSDRKDDVPLKGEHDRVGEAARARLRAAKARDLQNRRDGECAHLAVKLQYRCVCGGLGAERLVMQKDHALGAEAMFPCVNYRASRQSFSGSGVDQTGRRTSLIVRGFVGMRHLAVDVRERERRRAAKRQTLPGVVRE